MSDIEKMFKEAMRLEQTAFQNGYAQGLLDCLILFEKSNNFEMVKQEIKDKLKIKE